MTKKIISILLSVLMIFSALPVGVFAEANVELNLGTAQVDGADVKIPVTLSSLPDGFNKLASLDMSYSYDNDILTYEGIESAAITVGDSQHVAGGVSWFDSYSELSSADDTILFYLLFTAKKDTATVVSVTDAELGAGSYKFYKPATNKITVNASAASLSFQASVVDDTVQVAVVLDQLPGDIDNIASATIRYGYDKNVLIYKETLSGALDVTGVANDGSVSWFSSDKPVADIDDTVLFTLVFDVAEGAEGETAITPASAELVSSSYVVSGVVDTYGATVELGDAIDNYAWVTFDEPVIEGSEISVPVSISKIPDDIEHIASFTMDYTYDSSKIVFAGIEAGKMSVSEATSTAVKVSWFAQGEPVTDVSAPLFTIKFTIADGAEGQVGLDITNIEVSSNKAVSEQVVVTNRIIDLPAQVVEPCLTFGPAVVEGTKVSVPVMLNKIPDGLEDIASFTMEYTYTTELLTYAGATPGVMNISDITISHDTVSWFYTDALVTDVTAPLFTLNFDVNDGVSGTAYIDPTSVEIVSSAYVIADYVELEGTKIAVTGGTPAPVVVGIKTNIDELTLPLNTADIDEYIKANLKVYTVYSNGDETEITTGYTVDIADGDIKVTYGGFGADVALAYEKAEVKAGSAEVTGTERTFRIPVTMQGIPADLENVSAVTVEYTYPASVEYVATEAGVVPVNDITATDGKVSWFADAEPITSIDNSELFTLVFKAPCDAEAEFELVIDVEIADADGITENIVPVNGTVKVAAVEHDWSEWETTTAPTLDADGEQTRVCANCGETETRPVTMTDVVINKDTLDIPYRFQSADKKLPYIKSQLVATAVFSDGTEIVIPEPVITEEGSVATVTYKDFVKNVTLNLEAEPEKEEVYPDIPVIDDNREVKVPIIISGIPAGIDAIESIEIEYSFDDTNLIYSGTNSPEDDNLSADGSESGKAVVDIEIVIDPEDVDHTVKAIINFLAPCDAEGEAVISIDSIKINGEDVSDSFDLKDIVVNLVAQDCVFGQWQTAPGSDPKDYKNGKEIRYCQICGKSEERDIEVVDIDHAVVKITVPYANHYNKSEADIAAYLKTVGTLATAQLTNGEVVDIDNADITVVVDSTVPKAVITYVGAYNPATGETYDSVCEIALEYTPGQSGGGSGGGSYRPGNTGGNGGGVIITPPATPSGVFNDVPSTHYAYDAIKDLYDRGIISGDGSGYINPNLGITREETAKVALLINGIAVESGLPIDFDDKGEVSDWAYDYVATAIKHGVLKGYGDGTVRPRDTVSREEMVAIIIRALNVQVNGEIAAKFSDVSSDRWSAGYIVAASDLGLVTGYSDGTFKPAADITRAEAFTIYHRVLQFKESLTAAIQ